MSDYEHSLRQLAYRLWEEAGCPEGRADEFWYTALEVLAAESRPPEAPEAEPADASAEAPAPRPEAAEAASASARKSAPKD